MDKPILVAVVDDHAIVRQGLVGMLSRDDRFEVAGEADSGFKAIDLVVDTQPDVVLMDVSMPDLDGIAATRQIKKLEPETRVIALTMHQDRAHIRQAFEAGVSGYLLKRNDLGDLIAAIEAVMAGDILRRRLLLLTAQI
jgi:DNA-binding NarL/FixJ family response regulator